MTHREEFEKALREMKIDVFHSLELNDNGYGYKNISTTILFAGFRIGLKAAKAQAVPQWIPVSERLPDEDAVVVGRSDDPIEYCDYAVFNFFNGIFHLNTDGLEASNYDGGAVIKCEFAVTHWMPLPSAPEQNK